MKTFLLILVLFFSISSRAEESGEVTPNWKEVSPSYGMDSEKLFMESMSVDLFTSVLFLDGHLFYLMKEENMKSQILRVNLETGERKISPISEGKILGWTIHKDDLLLLVKNKLLILDPRTFAKRSEVPISIQSSNFREILVLNGLLYSFQSKKAFTYDLNHGEKKEERDVPFDSIQRVIKIDDNFVLLYSSFWGNKMKLINTNSFEMEKEIIIPTNHRSLFKLVYTDKKHFLVADPITKNYSEWMDFGGKMIEVTRGLQISSSPTAARYKPIENFIQYKIRITAKENTRETMLHFVLPVTYTYSQTVSEEKFSKASELKLDADGNRILSLPIPALTANEVFEHSPYEAKLTRYKIAFDLADLKMKIADFDIPKSLLRYTTNYPSLKFDESIVIKKREEVIGESVQVSEILNRTQTYVSSIPYKSGAFQSAPFVIEKNNGGCTEHSYVTMAFLRSLGIPSRLVWNYLPTESSEIIFFNHKFAEAWIPEYGWIPLEPLSSPNKIPGSTNARHVIFARLEKTSLVDIAGGDRLFNITKSDLGLTKKLQIRFDIFKSGVSEELELTPIKSKSLPKVTGEDMFVP